MLKIKSASIIDSLDILRWRNDSLSRKFSINKNLINSDDHNKWYKKHLDNDNNCLLICHNNREKIGFVKYEKFKNNKLYVSINLNPKFRNKGFGSKILIKSQNLKRIKESKLSLYARIRLNNFASIKVFENAGYKKIKKFKNYYLFCNNKNHDTLISMSKIKNKYEKIIDQIESVRSKNNGNWMDILRIAFKYSPTETAKVMSQIYKEDQKISTLAKKLEK